MIFIDFDETLVKTCYSEYAYSLLVAHENNSDDQIERLHARRARRTAFEALSPEKQKEFWLDRGCLPFTYLVEGFNIPYITALRPHAKEFIAECKKIAPTMIFTAGEKEYQTKVAELHGIGDVEIYGRNCGERVPKHPKNLLVDDLHYCTSGVQWKLECLGFETVETESGPLIPGDRHIQVSPWCGDQTDDELLDLLPKIKALL